MKKINLLPHKMQKAKDVRRITIIIAAVQAAIFLTAVLVYVFFSLWGARLSREIQGLTRLLIQNPVQQTADVNLNHFFHEEFLTRDALINVQKVTNGVRIVDIRFSLGEFSITAHTADILNIMAHIELLDEFFYDVRLTSIAATDEGMYIYELNLR